MKDEEDGKVSIGCDMHKQHEKINLFWAGHLRNLEIISELRSLCMWLFFSSSSLVSTYSSSFSENWNNRLFMIDSWTFGNLFFKCFASYREYGRDYWRNIFLMPQLIAQVRNKRRRNTDISNRFIALSCLTFDMTQ